MDNSLTVKILRQDGPGGRPYWETFSVTLATGATVHDVLEAIQRRPVNSSGRAVPPVQWECNCMEEVCGACTININGRPGLACGSVVEDRKPLTLAPLTKFPVIRDLVVDRTKIYGTYKRFKLYSAPDAPKTPPKHVWEQIYPMTRCMSCGACTEVCPNTGGKTAFTGAAGIAVLRTLTALGIQGDLYGLTDNNGITSCGGHSLCADICPKNIDLPAAVSAVNRDINKRVLRRIFNKRGGK